MDGDENVSLNDAGLALQVLAGQSLNGIGPGLLSSGADVNGDNRFGIEEMIYILEKVSGLRQ